MAVFVIAAVSLSQALNIISLTVVESIDESELRERIQGLLLEEGRNPSIREGSRKIPPSDNGISFEIRIERFELSNRDGNPLNNLFEVTVIAFRSTASEGTVEVSRATTLANLTLSKSL